MAPRAQLQSLLEAIPGIKKVYFQPPSNVVMEYPCIVYQRDGATTDYAGNAPYRYDQRYQVTLIDKKPDNGIVERIAFLPKTSYERFFVVNNLNHDVFTMYF